jgi:hypothetical protein
MPNLHLLTQTFSQARHASGTHQFNGLGPPLTLLRDPDRISDSLQHMRRALDEASA